MAKVKGPQGVQNRHIYSRASYLYQAAAYLASQQHVTAKPSSNSAAAQSDGHSAAPPTPAPGQPKAMQNMSRQMISSMRAVTLKAQIRQTPDLKRTICKYCDTLLVEGSTCTSTVENASKGGRKPWADVFQIKCRTCGHTKRYPVSALKQKRLRLRRQEAKENQDSEDAQDAPLAESLAPEDSATDGS